MSDGDNIQWMLNLFAEDSRWFGSQNRGLMDIGWTIPPSLSEIAPTVMAKIYSMAQSTELGKDYFVAGPSGHSYHFPELFPELEASCSLMNDYLEKSGLSIVNILGNNPSETVFQPELKQYLKQDQVSGLFYYDYSNYSKMQGQLDCYALKPLVAARYNLWGGFETCESLAQKINAAPKDPFNPNSYTLVAVHAWSNSVDSLLLVKSLLDQGVRVVAPDAFVQLISDAICAPQQQETLILEAFPNPFSETIRLKIKGYESSDFELKIQDVSGKEIRATQVRIETFDGWVCDFTFKNTPSLLREIAKILTKCAENSDSFLTDTLLVIFCNLVRSGFSALFALEFPLNFSMITPHIVFLVRKTKDNVQYIILYSPGPVI